MSAKSTLLPGTRKLLLLLSVTLLLMIAGCTSSYNSQKSWHRSPASTGHNRCGCLLVPSDFNTLKIYQQPTYALQA